MLICLAQQPRQDLPAGKNFTKHLMFNVEYVLQQAVESTEHFH